MRQAEGRRASDPERELLGMFENSGVSDLFDMFGEPDGDSAEDSDGRASRYGAAGDERYLTNDGPFPDVPDADGLAAGSPVDPAAPDDGFRGTDLKNGAG